MPPLPDALFPISLALPKETSVEPPEGRGASGPVVDSLEHPAA